MAKVDELVVKIEADFSDLKQQLKKAGDETEKFGNKVTQAGGETKSFGVSMASLGAKAGVAAIAVTALGAAAVALTRSQVKASKETKLWADRLDVSADRFSQLTVVARKFGGSVDDVGDSIKDLNERIADAARGNKTYEEALNMVGLASKDLINLDVDEQFLKVADAIGKMSNAGDRNFVTAELMADAGFRLIPMFQKGEQAIRGMMKSADELNQSLDTDQIEKFASLDQEFINLELSTDTLAKTMAESLAPILEESARLAGLVADEITKIFESEKKLEDQNLAEQLETQNQKLMKLKGSLLTAEAEVLNFGGAWDTFITGEEGKTVLEGNVERLKMQIRLTTAEIDRLNATKMVGGLASDTGGGGQSNQGRTGILGSVGEASSPEEAELAKKEEYFPIFLNMEAERLMAESDLKREARLAEEAEQQAFLDREFGAEDKHAQRMKMLWDAGNKGKLKATSTMLGQLSGLMNSGSKKMFQVGKVAALAQATIDTYQGAQSSFAAGAKIGGPPVGAAFAAVAVATGLANIQKIQSTSFGSGGGGAAGGGGAVGGVGDVAQGGGGTENVTNFDVNLQGQSFTGEQIRGLIGSINSEIEDGAKLGAINVR